MFEIGQEVKLNGETYKIVGTHKRSFIIEKDGQKYKATAKKMKAIQEYKQESAMERRLKWERIFNPNAKLPETEAEILRWADKIAGDLSPENLCCDGEASPAQVRNKRRELNQEHKELEALLGRSIELVI